MSLQEWKIQKHGTACFDSGRKLEEGETFFSAIFWVEGEFQRRDYSAESWERLFGEPAEGEDAEGEEGFELEEAPESAEVETPVTEAEAEAPDATEAAEAAGANSASDEVEVDEVEVDEVPIVEDDGELPYSFWRTRMPRDDEPPRIPFTQAIDFFWKLIEDRKRKTDSQELIFPLALLLLRKRNLKLADTVRRRGREVMILTDPEGERTAEVYDPGLEGDAIEQVEDQIRELLFPHLPKPKRKPAEETSGEEASGEETPGEETPGEETPGEETPGEETRAEGESAETESKESENGDAEKADAELPESEKAEGVAVDADGSAGAGGNR